MHGENAEKHAGREYWSRRLPGTPSWGRIGKWLTHRRERAAVRRAERRLMKLDYLEGYAGSSDIYPIVPRSDDHVGEAE